MLSGSSPGRYWQRSQFERFNEAAAFAAEQRAKLVMRQSEQRNASMRLRLSPQSNNPCCGAGALTWICFNEAAAFAAEQPVSVSGRLDCSQMLQ